MLSLIGLENIASHLVLDAKYVCSLFRQRLSMSPYRYLTDVWMRKASRLLRGQLLGITEIARAVGYQDQLLFSRMFKRIRPAPLLRTEKRPNLKTAVNSSKKFASKGFDRKFSLPSRLLATEQLGLYSDRTFTGKLCIDPVPLVATSRGVKHFLFLQYY
jgi:hypothetical protein